MNFKTLSFTVQRFQISQKSGKIDQNFKILYFCKNLTESSQKLIYFTALTSVPNMKALASILFEISCTQDFQILFSKGHNSEKGHNSDMKKNTGQLFFS